MIQPAEAVAELMARNLILERECDAIVNDILPARRPTDGEQFRAALRTAPYTEPTVFVGSGGRVAFSECLAMFVDQHLGQCLSNPWKREQAIVDFDPRLSVGGVSWDVRLERPSKVAPQPLLVFHLSSSLSNSVKISAGNFMADCAAVIEALETVVNELPERLRVLQTICANIQQETSDLQSVLEAVSETGQVVQAVQDNTSELPTLSKRSHTEWLPRPQDFPTMPRTNTPSGSPDQSSPKPGLGL